MDKSLGLDNALLVGSEDQETPPQEPFYTRPWSRWYPGEQRLAGVPVARTIALILAISVALSGAVYVNVLCTVGMKWIFGISLAASCVALLFTIVADSPVSFPSTWTFHKINRVPSSLCAFACFYQAVLFGVVVALVISSVLVNLFELKDLFDWECEPEHESKWNA
mmetsp:Transcript_16769/g.48846  ORF Transcript_16769/g.48846 Transcript_16769/m.48846 type:complete len:166 (-) Transcript_16769:25-522(-)|eukprot:CAMPEP_0118963344 /NCGR_PEP_ID=MMETSP1173-20130426/1286_1 /TAXON_ID=1034831 /ORGANISM="Rhizochromulina marina cf, Strain CCMP1243" /LENGTH=165 /DNA_ID=CAMNT_0006911667 /DNA_START=92 /DNA_END=589 /DNA_ORIENTATION=-